MAVPVSIRTKNQLIADLCKPPLLGGFVILLIAFGPPTLIALLIHTILNCNSYRFHLCGVAGLEDLKEMSILTL